MCSFVQQRIAISHFGCIESAGPTGRTLKRCLRLGLYSGMIRKSIKRDPQPRIFVESTIHGLLQITIKTI